MAGILTRGMRQCLDSHSARRSVRLRSERTPKRVIGLTIHGLAIAHRRCHCATPTRPIPEGIELAMRHHAKLIMAALVGALVFAAAVGTASARRFLISSSGQRIAWAQLRFAGTAEGPSATCPVTMEGTFHSRTISKVSGQLIGFITRAIVGAQASCTFANGAERLVILGNTLPWHIRYDSFTGALPSIRTVKTQFVGMGYQLFVLGTACLYKTTAARPLFFFYFLSGTEGTPGTIPLFEGNAVACPGATVLEGVDSVTELGNTIALTIRLVQ
jgi:hypothetical protein